MPSLALEGVSELSGHSILLPLSVHHDAAPEFLFCIPVPGRVHEIVPLGRVFLQTVQSVSVKERGDVLERSQIRMH